MSDPITAIGLAASVVQLSDLAGRVFVRAFQFYRDVKDAPARSKELRDELQLVADLLDSLKEVCMVPDLQLPGQLDLGRLGQSLTQFDEFLTSIDQRITMERTRGLKRLKWPFSIEETQRLLESIGRYKETFNWALNMHQTSSSNTCVQY
jgi:hypothetical protein